MSGLAGISSKPVTLECPVCKATVVTMMKHKTVRKTHLWAVLMCFSSCWLCSCLPYCLESCRDAEHYCPHCKNYIGTCTK